MENALDENDFVDYLRDELTCVYDGKIEEWSRDDVDSLLFAETILAVENLGVVFSEDWFSDVEDLGDLYSYYLRAFHERRPDASARPPLSSTHAVLRPLFPDDVTQLYSLVQHPEVSRTWRFRGQTPSPEAFYDCLWHKVIAQFVICRHSSSAAIGLVTAFNGDFRNGHCELSVVAAAQMRTSPVIAQGIIQFVDYVFETFGFRKVYLETLDCNVARLGIDRHIAVEVEGRKRAHERVSGEWTDLVVGAIYRDAWERTVGRLVSPRSVPDIDDGVRGISSSR